MWSKPLRKSFVHDASRYGLDDYRKECRMVKSTRNNPFEEIYRSCNTGSNEEKYRLIQTGAVSLPRYLDVELTNNCNFRCRFCPTGTKSLNRMRGFMSDAVADALAENVHRYKIPGVRFIRWGEPTLHPRYIEIMRLIKNAGAKIHVNTNGSLLDEAHIYQLLDIPLDSIKFSFQGADKGTYSEMREGGDYQRLLSTIRLMRHAGEKKRTAPPYIQITTTLTIETAEQIEHFKQDIEGLCDFYNIGYTKLNHLDVSQMNIPEREKEKIRALQKQETIRRRYKAVCSEAFDKLSVNWNGDVTICCSDYDNFMIVGNLLDMDIKAIFNSNAADADRTIIAQGQYGKIKCCSTCYETVPLTK